MFFLICLAIIAGIIWAIWSIVSSEILAITEILLIYMPLIVASLVVGITSTKRLSPKAGYWIITGMIAAQIVAVLMLVDQLYIPSMYGIQFIISTIGLSVIFAIPGFFINSRGHY